MDRMIEPAPAHHQPHDGAADPAAVGSWEPVRYRCASLPIHTALLHTGQVLTFGGTGNNARQTGCPHPAELWDPASGAMRVVDQELGGDLFCAGHAYLPDGRLLVAGGTRGYDIKRRIFGMEIPLPPFSGLRHTYLFDPMTEQWTRGDDMAAGRWYPTLVTLGDGRVIAMAGLTEHFPWVVLRKIEIYTPGAGWQTLRGADRWLPLYPRLHLLPDGRVFYSGSYNTHYTYPFSLQQFPTSILDPATGKWDRLGLPNRSEREEGATVLLPLDPPYDHPRVLLAGGGTPGGAVATSECEVIDLSEAPPRWQVCAPMQHPRYYVYPVLLPDGRLLVVGGRSGTTGHDMPHPAPGDPHHPHPSAGAPDGGIVEHDPRSVMEPELFDPTSGSWTNMAPMAVDRLYHSSALLLPDGRVAVFGNNPMQGKDELRIEIFHPPYLFCGPRPEIALAPGQALYGETIEIGCTPAGAIDQVVLLHPITTTHCLATEQRLVRLAFSRSGPDQLRATLPTNPNVLPPGYYMLFVLANGVPSIGKMIRVASR